MMGKNALSRETSPYLLQHATNPVDWYPWCEAALRKAREENKPILLSVGYSACHWCHVMAHESFEDAETAALMNKLFVNIKVDREERPDLDKIYQTAQQLLTQKTGGWPLTMFLAPEDQTPFFGGTYFPPDARYGMPGFKDLLMRVAEFYKTEAANIRKQNASLLEAMNRLQEQPESATDREIDLQPLAAAIGELSRSFDGRYGGFGGAPKFPHPTNIEVLLAAHDLQQDEQTLAMALASLEKMALGGIYDQLGGGFCRYSVDRQWMIPHFEKMLYDNGPLLALYSDAWHLTGNPLFEKVATETAAWVIRDMQSADGGFFSSLDADSEGVEGKFYVWDKKDAANILNAVEHECLSAHFGLDRTANFDGKWHLYVSKNLEQVAAELERDPDDVRVHINHGREKLLAARDTRIHPGRDEKILTSWNALMIKGLIIAGLRLQREDLIDAAERALTFIQTTLWRDQRLLATCKDGRAHLNAYLDDYAFLLDALLWMLSARWSDRWLQFTMALAAVLIDNFHDDRNGGFFFTPCDHERLIQRRKDFMDDALPAGNGIAARALISLGHLLGDHDYLQTGRQVITAAWPALQRVPHAHDAVLLALLDLHNPPRQIIVRSESTRSAPDRRRLLPLLAPRDRLYSIPADTPPLPGLLRERSAAGQISIYVCTGFQCLAPMHEIDGLIQYLKNDRSG